MFVVLRFDKHLNYKLVGFESILLHQKVFFCVPSNGRPTTLTFPSSCLVQTLEKIKIQGGISMILLNANSTKLSDLFH